MVGDLLCYKSSVSEFSSEFSSLIMITVQELFGDSSPSFTSINLKCQLFEIAWIKNKFKKKEEQKKHS